MFKMCGIFIIDLLSFFYVLIVVVMLINIIIINYYWISVMICIFNENMLD